MHKFPPHGTAHESIGRLFELIREVYKAFVLPTLLMADGQLETIWSKLLYAKGHSAQSDFF